MIEELKTIAAKKREEFESALAAGQVQEPISLTAILTSLAISAAVSAASYGLSVLLAPKRPTQQTGKIAGDLQLQNSTQGAFIPEVYGAGPTVSLVPGSNPTYQNLTNTTGGANGSITKTSGTNNVYNAGASHNTAVSSGDAFIEVIVGSGPATAGFATNASPTDDDDFEFGVQWHSEGTVQVNINGGNYDVGHYNTGDKFRVEIRNGKYRLFHNFAEIAAFPVAVPDPSYPLYFGVAMYATGSGISNGKIQIGSIGDPPNQGLGGVKVPAIIVYASGIRKHVTTTQVGGGKGHPSQTVENIYYDIDLGLMFCRGPVDLLKEYANADVLINQDPHSTAPTGAYDSGVGADPDYDPSLPPDPRSNYVVPIDRVDGDILDGSGDGSGGGTIQQGSSSFAIYPGNDIQLQDPTIQADIDGKHGAGSTPAFRNHSLIVHTAFNLSRWSGIVPNMTAVWQHQDLKLLNEIYESFADRVGLVAADDFDLSGMADIACRGLVISGGRFSPASIMDSPELQCAYNYFVTEAEGQILGFENGNEPTLTIADTEVGWLDGETDTPDVLSKVISTSPEETSLENEVDVRYIDPNNDWDPNMQPAFRHVTTGQGKALIEVQATLLPDEARAAGQRKLYRDYVADPIKFTLPWTYLYLYPGYKIIINRSEGFVHTLRLKSISGGIGILECEGEALEPAAYTQPATGAGPPNYNPPQPIPAMTVTAMMNLPGMRPEDVGQFGFYAAGTPRTSLFQTYPGFNLRVSRGGAWTPLEEFREAAIMGKIVSATSLSTDPTTTDNVGVIIVDLYGTTAILESVTEAEMIAGANRAVFGDMVGGFATAVQSAGFPNRWTLTVLRNGQLNTDPHISDDLTGRNFVLFNDAVKFIPLDPLNDLNTTLTYKAVTVGQSLSDAAEFDFACTGQSLRPDPPTSLTAERDASDDWYIAAVGHPRVNEIPASFVARIRKVSDGSLLRDLPIAAGTYRQAAMFGTPAGPLTITNNNIVGTTSGLSSVEGLQQILTEGMQITFKMTLPGMTGGFADAVQFYLEADGPGGFGPACGLDATFVDANTTSIAGLENFDTVIPAVNVTTVDGVCYILIALVGTEVRIYASTSGIPVPGTSKAVLIGKEVSTLFPATIKVFVTGVGKVENIWIAGLTDPRTIYALRQQQADLGEDETGAGSSTIDVELWQATPYPGINGFSVRGTF